jgi:hypothetical protein
MIQRVCRAAIAATGVALSAWSCGSAERTASTAPITLPDCEVNGPRVSPGAAQLHVGDTVRLTADLGPPCPWLPIVPLVFTWTASDTSIATVDGSPASALVHARKPGNVSIIATLDAAPNVRGAAAIQVVP